MFQNIGEETSEQLEHLISTIENQATQIDALHAERDQIEKQLQNEIKHLQRLGPQHSLLNVIDNSL